MIPTEETTPTTPTPIPLSVEAIKATAARIGFTFWVGRVWIDIRKKCGCAGGIAAILRDQTILDRYEIGPFSWEITRPGCLSRAELGGLNVGFERKDDVDSLKNDPDYLTAKAIGATLRAEMVP